MKLCWATDIHLNFLNENATFLLGELWAESYDSLVISGDIAEATNVRSLLCALADGFGKPVYFVLGNHDYYQGSIADVRAIMQRLHDSHPNLFWLDVSEPVFLDDQAALVGHQGWYDGILGDPQGSRVLMSDFEFIKDFRSYYNPRTWLYYGGAKDRLLGKLKELSQQAAEEARVNLRKALEARHTVLFATHYPPFAGACWHEGKLSNRHWMPWFTSACMGEMLADEACNFPDNEIIVLCGHTHSSGHYQHLDNLTVLTGAAEYGDPQPVMYFETPIKLKVT